MSRKPILEFKAKEFGETIRRIRQQRGLSLQAVDAQTGICYQQILSVERGRNTLARATIPLASWAQIDPDDFVTVNRREAR